MGPTSALAIDRRTFIGRCATSGAALLALTALACGGHNVGDRRQLANPLLLGALGAARVTAIGKRWLRLTPAERSADALVAAIAARLNGAPWARARTVEEAVADDFEQGRTVMVDGWMLAVTEARQCALFSLLAG